MLEKPPIQDEKILTGLQEAYGLHVRQIAFLPLGADQNTAVYRAADDHKSYFVKLRRGRFDEVSVALPKFLSEQGISQIIPPLTRPSGQLWAKLEAYTVILYPFIEGRNGYEVNLCDQHWRELGIALKSIHTLQMPAELLRRIQHETFSSQWRDKVRALIQRVEVGEVVDDAVAQQVAALLSDQRAAILDLIARAEQRAQSLQTPLAEWVVCHSDLHAGNFLIEKHGALYIVDWDAPILAPKERDLMYAGAGLGGAGHTPQTEEACFYEGYGQAQIDRSALAYYRYERIVQDIAAFCEELLLTTAGGDDREQSLRYLQSNFLPGGMIEIAYEMDNQR